MSRPEGRATIPIELLIGEREQQRMRVGLCHDISLKPFMGGRRVAMIDDADHLKQPEGSNCLLKTLEEPPPRSVLDLIGTTPNRQLPTIRSPLANRSLPAIGAGTRRRAAPGQGLVSDPAEARRLATYIEGSISRAMELADPELWNFRGQLLARLAAPGEGLVGFTKSAGALLTNRHGSRLAPLSLPGKS